MKIHTRLALGLILAVGLILGGCGILTKQEARGLAESLHQARTLVVAVSASTPDLVAVGDLSQRDADWLAEQVGHVLPILDTAIAIANGSLQGDPVEQIDLAIAALRAARAQTGNEKAWEQLGRLTAGLVFYRNVLAADLARTASAAPAGP